MGMNSTDTAYNFGQFGSTLLTGDGAILNLTSASAKYYVCAIQMIDDVRFGSTGASGLQILDGGVDLGMGKTHFVSTEDTQTLDTDWGGETAESDNDQTVYTAGSGGVEFKAGTTIYGMWDNVELNSGSAVVYVAPRPDYRNRA